LAEAPGHHFYKKLELLEKASFYEFYEAQFYHEKLSRPSVTPGMYFRVTLIGFFEGIESERGMAWRVADSLQQPCPGDQPQHPAEHFLMRRLVRQPPCT
jgi:transposase